MTGNAVHDIEVACPGLVAKLGRLDITEDWAFEILKFAESLVPDKAECDRQRDETFEAGREDGWDAGFEDGQNSDSMQLAKREAEDRGYAKGREDTRRELGRTVYTEGYEAAMKQAKDEYLDLQQPAFQRIQASLATLLDDSFPAPVPDEETE